MGGTACTMLELPGAPWNLNRATAAEVPMFTYTLGLAPGWSLLLHRPNPRLKPAQPLLYSVEREKAIQERESSQTLSVFDKATGPEGR